MHQFPRREKLVHLVGFALTHEHITVNSISKYLDCTIRTAQRLLNMLNDMKHELPYLIIEKSGVGRLGDPFKLRVRINNKWL